VAQEGIVVVQLEVEAMAVTEEVRLAVRNTDH